MISSLLEILQLKELPRAGWLRAGVKHPESVASHSWNMSFLVMILLPPELNMERALQYAIIHDLPEVRTGDITPYDGIEKAEKYTLEKEALEGLSTSLPNGDFLRKVWNDYESQTSEEARFVRQIDRLDMALQAKYYQQTEAIDPKEFLSSAEEFLTDPALKKLFAQLGSHNTSR